MHRQFDHTLEASLDLTATPPFSRRLAWLLFAGLVLLLGWYAWTLKVEQDEAAAARKLQKRPVAPAPR